MKKGFTLLEMVIVLMVIGAIFLLMVPNISKVTSIVNDESCDNQLRIVDTAIIEYQIMYDELPTSVEDLIMEDLLSEKQAKCRNGKMIDIIDGKAEAN
ncbi:MAG: prepilin-type N-terminal cleavage/methylation domain-containing protein [Erysipelotrichaceae bacterium]|nr:prepilin-type N-terminal cleavage/methylation domain-containing protein [Erysipelotrichaceae bacterium]MDD3923500.1 prepilin-type N-terminal cleavage/methylation domain-containing protein [Erysipelotrichaceae bacterium]MDD4642546.1 prepilin-type N-terminal cleavage/methylation domain-containing protein [Erysipelotrichaceae bacterium]